MRSKKELAALLKSREKGVIVDLGGGGRPHPGAINVDIRDLPTVDVVQDLETFPWALPDECASLVIASHLVEHINPAKGIFLKFMDEVWRILKPGGQFMIATPYGGSPGFWQDPTHCNGCNEVTWAYFDPLGSAYDPQAVLYSIYKPKPWKILSNDFDPIGNMEVCLEKLRVQKRYLPTKTDEKK